MNSIHWLDYIEAKEADSFNLITVILVGFVIGLLLGYFGSGLIW